MIRRQRYSGIEVGIFLHQFNHDHSGMDSCKAVFQKLKIIFTRSLTLPYFPITDFEPTNLTCTYSTLLFIQSRSNKLNISTPVITSDQPLWYKASGIIAEKKLDMVCRLHEFHVLMSFITGTRTYS